MATSAASNESAVPENVTSQLMGSNWTTTTAASHGMTAHLASPDEGIINHHRDLMDWSMLHPEYHDNRELLDRPLMGIAIIGGFFLTISLLLIVAILVFYLKRNTVFVLEKSVHGGFYEPGDPSVVIGQTATARQLGMRTSRVQDWTDENELEDEDEDDVDEVEEVGYDSLTAPNRSRTSMLGSYLVHPDHVVYMNPQHRPHTSRCTHALPYSSTPIPLGHLCQHGKLAQFRASNSPVQIQDNLPSQNDTLLNPNARIEEPQSDVTPPQTTTTAAPPTAVLPMHENNMVIKLSSESGRRTQAEQSKFQSAAALPTDTISPLQSHQLPPLPPRPRCSPGHTSTVTADSCGGLAEQTRSILLKSQSEQDHCAPDGSTLHLFDSILDSKGDIGAPTATGADHEGNDGRCAP